MGVSCPFVQSVHLGNPWPQFGIATAHSDFHFSLYSSVFSPVSMLHNLINHVAESPCSDCTLADPWPQGSPLLGPCP